MSDNNANSSPTRHKFFLSNFFWGFILFLVFVYQGGKVIPPIHLLMLVALPYLLTAAIMETEQIGNDLDLAGIPRTRQFSYWIIGGCWLLIFADAGAGGKISWAMILGIALLLIDLKNIPKLGGYLWVRRGFLSFVLGFFVSAVHPFGHHGSVKNVSETKVRRKMPGAIIGDIVGSNLNGTAAGRKILIFSYGSFFHRRQRDVPGHLRSAACERAGFPGRTAAGYFERV